MNILLLSHSTGIPGPIDFLEQYCLQQKHTVYKLQHPLDDYTNKQTIAYKNKQVVFIKARKHIGIVNVLLDCVYSLFFTLRHTVEICVGANNIDTLVALVARNMFRKKITHIIYFAADFSEKRFHNTLLDGIYMAIERSVLKHADLIISNTKRAEAKRLTLGLLPEKSMVIPNGVALKHPVFHKKRIDKHAFIYVGNVNKEHGLLSFLETMHPLLKKLVVIGQGEQWSELQTLCNRYAIACELHHAKPHEFVIQYLQNFSGIGLAPYDKSSLWTYYCSPLKVNEYIACGLPVLISDVPEISHMIRKKKLGITYTSLSLSEIEKSLDMFSTEQFYKKAETFYQEYTYDSLYREIFRKFV